MAFVLVTTRGRKLGMAIPIRRRVFVIGSAPSSDVRSRKPGIGRRHCALLVRKKQLFIQDLGSGYPTQVNGLTLVSGVRQPLKIGDRVALGPMEFVIGERAPRPKGVVPVAAPHGAPTVPMGRPVRSPQVVPVGAALAPAPRPGSKAWSVVLLVAMACVGLGGGVLLSQVLINSQDPRSAK